jgi:hypothetical protein
VNAAKGLLLLLLILAATWQLIRSNGPMVYDGSRFMPMAGDPVPAANVADIERQLVRLDSVHARHTCGILYFFDWACAACESAAPAWSGRSDVAGMFVAWVSVTPLDDSARTYVNRHRLIGPIYDASRAIEAGVLPSQAVPRVWAVSEARIVLTATGSRATHPDTLARDLEWCNEVPAQ